MSRLLEKEGSSAECTCHHIVTPLSGWISQLSSTISEFTVNSWMCQTKQNTISPSDTLLSWLSRRLSWNRRLLLPARVSTVLHSWLIIIWMLFFSPCDCGAAGIVDLSGVHCYENDAKWQETDVSGFNHALQMQILTAVSPGLACSTPV